MTPPDDVVIYLKYAMRVIGIGLVGPTKGVTIPKHLALLLMEKSSDWSFKPFETKQEEVEKDE